MTGRSNFRIVRVHRESTPLGIGQPKASPGQLLFEDAVLFSYVRLVDRAAQRLCELQRVVAVPRSFSSVLCRSSAQLA